MEPIDWEQVHLKGMKGYDEAIKAIEDDLVQLNGRVADLTLQMSELRAGALPEAASPAERMELVWFRRYAGLMLALLEAGLPEDLEVEQIGGWLKGLGQGRPSGGGNGNASAVGGRTGNGTGCGLARTNGSQMAKLNTGCGACANFSQCDWLMGAERGTAA